MLKVDPRDFCKLFSILFCKAVPGVGGTVCGVFKDKDPNEEVGDGEVMRIRYPQHPPDLLAYQ